MKTHKPPIKCTDAHGRWCGMCCHVCNIILDTRTAVTVAVNLLKHTATNCNTLLYMAGGA